MNVSDYERRCAELGIGRGCLAGGFPVSFEPLGRGCLGHERELINDKAGFTVDRAALGVTLEDLSHLNPQRPAGAQAKMMAAMKRYWGALPPEERRRRARANAIGHAKADTNFTNSHE